MKNKKLLPFVTGMLTLSLFTGCSDTTSNVNTEKTQVSEEGVTSTANTQTATLQQMSAIQSLTIEQEEAHYPFDWRSESYQTINLSEGSATITQSGIYELTGTLEEGSVVVDINKDVDNGTVFIILNGVTINSTTGTPVHVIDADKVVFLLEEGTTNTITQGEIVTEDEDFPSGAIYSKADTVITGEGTLYVETAYNDGISGRDDLIITSGNIEIKAVGDGIVGKDLLAIEQGHIVIEAGKDGLKSTNDTDEGRGNVIIADGNITIKAANDGIQAENKLQIDGGTFDIASGNGYTGVIKVNEGELQKDMQEAANMTGGMARPNGTMMPEGSMVSPEGTMMPEGGMARPEGTMMPEGSMVSPEGAVMAEGDMARPEGMSKEDMIASGTTKVDKVQQGVKPSMDMILEDENEEDVATESMKALKSDGEILITGGNFILSSYEDAIHAAVNIEITGGEFIINAGDDAIHSDEAVSVIDGQITVENCFEGIEGKDILIAGGTIDIFSTDDGLNVFDLEGLMTIAGGTIALVPGNDGLDSNGDLTITGGDIVVDTTNINERNSAVDSEGIITFTGGTIVDQNGTAIDPTIQRQPGAKGMQDPSMNQQGKANRGQ